MNDARTDRRMDGRKAAGKHKKKLVIVIEEKKTQWKDAQD